VDASQRRELSRQVSRSTGSYELVFSSVLLALAGLALDRWLGTLPWCTVVLAALGFAGAAVKLYYTYVAEMEQHEANGPWAKRS
jgi:F0F1-type ATP synthase assembly protein I